MTAYLVDYATAAVEGSYTHPVEQRIIRFRREGAPEDQWLEVAEHHDGKLTVRADSALRITPTATNWVEIEAVDRYFRAPEAVEDLAVLLNYQPEKRRVELLRKLLQHWCVRCGSNRGSGCSCLG